MKSGSPIWILIQVKSKYVQLLNIVQDCMQIFAVRSIDTQAQWHSTQDAIWKTQAIDPRCNPEDPGHRPKMHPKVSQAKH
jgi:hypothetical protein